MKNKSVKCWVASLLLILLVALSALCHKLYEDQKEIHSKEPTMNLPVGLETMG